MVTPGKGPHDKADQILQAARRVLGEKGYAQATISQVAAEAGVSRGLLHYYFKNKQDMLARVMRQAVEGAAALAEGIFSQAATAEELAAGICQGARGFAQSDPHFARIFFESWGLARQSEVLAAELQAMYRGFTEAVRRGMEHAAGQGAIPRPADPQAAAVVLTALIDGLSLQVMSMPELLDREDTWQAAQKAVLCVLRGG